MAGARKGVASLAWAPYDPNPNALLGFVPKKRFTYIPRKSRANRDPMCDYIEGASWWIARSRFSTRALQKAFDQQEVACVLYERTGAIVDLGREGTFHKMGIQLVRYGRADKDWDLDLSLSEAGIIIDEEWIE